MIAPTPWIGTLARALETTSGPFTPDEVHDLRVALGRLSVWVSLAGRRMLRDDLTWLRRSAAELRDLDVLLANHAGESWTSGLALRRAHEERALGLHLGTERARALCFALGTLPPLQEGAARKCLAGIVRRVQRAARRAALAPEDDVVLHRWRRRVRKLRYALELLGQPSERVHVLQDELGLLHDRVVALAHFNLAPRANQDIELALRLEAEIARQRTRASEAWSNVRALLEQN
jgi:CHAD domain-containing protein